jgi:hypothetical protein
MTLRNEVTVPGVTPALPTLNGSRIPTPIARWIRCSLDAFGAGDCLSLQCPKGRSRRCGKIVESSGARCELESQQFER